MCCGIWYYLYSNRLFYPPILSCPPIRAHASTGAMPVIEVLPVLVEQAQSETKRRSKVLRPGRDGGTGQPGKRPRRDGQSNLNS